MKKFALLVYLLFSFAATIAIAQTGFALYFAHSTIAVHRADLVVVLAGNPQRIEVGSQLIRQGVATHFLITGHDARMTRKISQKYGLPESVVPLGGGKSRSTFEDVFTTAKVLRAHHLTSLVLVTSSYHMPRALFLLKTYLVATGQQVSVQWYPVRTLHTPRQQLKAYYNEAIKLWGSSVEMAGALLSHRLLLNRPRILCMRNLLKQYLLLHS